MKRVLVADLMTRNVNTISPDTTLFDAARKMVKHRTGALLITDKKELTGFISNKDILWALVKKSKIDLSKIKSIEISPKKIITIKPGASLEDAINKMKKTKNYRLPVVKNKKLVGIITMKDILNFHPESYEELREISRIREEEEKINRVKKAEKREIVEDGICGECGNRGALYRENGTLICFSCLESI